jgi:hypothetical protein
MAKVLVWHDVSEQFAEIDERHLAHPVLGPHYHVARLNADGKPYLPQKGKKASDVEAEMEETSDKADK